MRIDVRVSCFIARGARREDVERSLAAFNRAASLPA